MCVYGHLHISPYPGRREGAWLSCCHVAASLFGLKLYGRAQDWRMRGGRDGVGDPGHEPRSQSCLST